MVFLSSLQPVFLIGLKSFVFEMTYASSVLIGMLNVTVNPLIEAVL